MADQLTRRPKAHYQIGAPALIYREKIGKESAFLQVSGHNYPPHCSVDIAEHVQRKNRLATRWNFLTGDVPPINARKRRKGRLHKHSGKALQPSIGSDDSLQEQRRRIVLHHKVHREVVHDRLLKTYADHDKPYELLNYILRPENFSRPSNNLLNDRAVKLGTGHKVLGRNLALQHHVTADPAYLAPFGLEALKKAKDERLPGEHVVDKSKTDCFGARPWQGNCLLCLPCPCPTCHLGNPSWCLFHPKGHQMDTLCVSNVMLPNTRENAGHFFPVSTWQEMRYDIRHNSVSSCKSLSPNEVCLHDTILEVVQSGKWSGDYPEGIVIVRTASYISAIRVSLAKPGRLLFRNPSSKRTMLDDEDLCWGNYVLREETRIDLRSLINGAPSYYPVSVACHPRYGNDFTFPKFAFVSHSLHNKDQNTVHHVSGYTPSDDPTIHPISSLRYISSIDFTKTHPMCLWCAASSYVRPTLVPEIWFKNQYPLGFGTSVYTIDLRSNSSIFQWSPSAEEMKQEGTYSISGLRLDWEREHTLWVASRSAGKTWELDSRMPCKAVHSWSLGSSCDLDSTSFPERGPFGDPTLLTQVRDSTLGSSGQASDSNFLVTADTTPHSFGFQVLQRPLHEPRFQTDSLECIAAPFINFAEHESSIATTSVFALPECDNDLYTCGLACFRTAINQFLSDDVDNPIPFESTDQVVCTLTMNNQGDLHCHSLLETSRHIPECRSFPGLPAGTAVIPVPKGLDGRTHGSEHKRWKPTGGMNLKAFWTNHYPISRNARPFIHPTIAKSVKHPRRKAKYHTSSKLGIGSGRFEVPVPQAGTTRNVQLTGPDGSRLLNQSGQPLVIPQATADKAFEMRLSFRDSHVGSAKVKEEATNKDVEDDNEEEAEETIPRSDLNPSTLERVSNTWHLWNQLDAESSSDEDEGGGIGRMAVNI